MSYICFQDVEKTFGDLRVLKGINLTVERGIIATLLGPSGCGKSTLLRCLAGLEKTDGGTILLDGQDITGWDPGKRKIGMVFQQYSLFPNMTAAENIAFGLRMQKVPSSDIRARVSDAIRLVELAGKEKEYPSRLSGGQQQRVALARSLVMNPKVLLLDEPMSAIDAKLRKALQKQIMEIQRSLGLTVIFVTHDQDEAMVMSDVIHLFREGQIVQTGSPVDIYTRPADRFAAGFIGSYNILGANEFSAITGEESEAAHVGIRPETIAIARMPEATTEDSYHLEGVVTGSSPRGNVLRYSVRVGESELQADVLFRSFTLFQAGTKVYLSIPRRDCLRLE